MKTIVNWFEAVLTHSTKCVEEQINIWSSLFEKWVMWAGCLEGKNLFS